MRSAGLVPWWEDLGLDLLDVLVQAVDHRLVVVHDLVEDGVQHRPGTEPERSGPTSIRLRTSPRALAGLWRTATTNWGPMKSMISPELDGVGLLHVAGGLEDHEQGVVVDLELGPLVGVDGVLDGQLVEVELAADRVELGLVGLVQADPDEGVLGVPSLVRLVQGDRTRPPLPSS